MIEQLISVGHPNRPGTKLETPVKAGIFHYTANDKAQATAIANAKYFGRPYVVGYTWDAASKTFVKGVVEAWSVGKTSDPKDKPETLPTPLNYGVAFSYGSTHWVSDMVGTVQVIPPNEAAWSAGDRHCPFDPVYRGQKPLAKMLCGNRQNYQTVSIEVCNNDVVEDSDVDWQKALSNAKDTMVDFFISSKIKIDIKQSIHPVSFSKLAPGYALILRHYDLTGKMCPLPLVQDLLAWEALVQEVGDRINSKLS